MTSFSKQEIAVLKSASQHYGRYICEPGSSGMESVCEGLVLKGYATPFTWEKVGSGITLTPKGINYASEEP
ncbi:hypothetical protein [Rhizobium sp. BK661]|uniref:hypothetical protein n=1 Tax=Rhizobium sp. BK661 TaxID=2586991 RepID=UPI00216750DC|nr:hypothetical protein [Rhizobium sp. BK661]MCS3742010.1 hypothetical protein [Rhizobium sp. BK661]